MNSNTLACYSWVWRRIRQYTHVIAPSLRIFGAVNNQETLTQTVFKVLFFLIFALT